MKTIFFISDPHFGHDACCHTFKLSDGSPLRPFKDAAECDEAIIERVNKVVKPQDSLYILGDVAINKKHIPTVKRLNGHKRLIFGNHDIFDWSRYVDAGFEKLMGYRVLDRVIFSHIPVHESQLARFSANVHGHLHANRVIGPGGFVDDRYISVCVEQTDYAPVSFEEIKQRILFH